GYGSRGSASHERAGEVPNPDGEHPACRDPTRGRGIEGQPLSLGRSVRQRTRRPESVSTPLDARTLGNSLDQDLDVTAIGNADLARSFRRPKVGGQTPCGERHAIDSQFEPHHVEHRKAEYAVRIAAPESRRDVPR